MKEIREVLENVWGLGQLGCNVGKTYEESKQIDVDQTEAKIKKIVAGEYKSGYRDALNGRPFRKNLEGELERSGRERKVMVMEKIFQKEEKEFLKLWHAYHAKYKMPYSHDDAKDFFLKLTVVFKEEKDKGYERD